MLVPRQSVHAYRPAQEHNRGSVTDGARMKHARAHPRTICALGWGLRAGGTARSRQVPGQVTIEFALAAVGVVMLGLVAAKTALWMNQSMVDRNLNYQRTRLAAASSSPGAPFAGPSSSFYGPSGQIHLIGPSTGHTPLYGSGGTIAVDHNCGAGATAKYNQAKTDRDNATTAMNTADTDSTTYKDTANKAADLINANAPSAPRVCTGDQCKSANWYWKTAVDLADAQQDLIDANNITCGNCTTEQTEMDAKCDVGVPGVCAAFPPPSAKCTAANNECTHLTGVYNTCDATRVTCETDKAADIADAQARIDAICGPGGAMTGNPWVGGAPASCTAADLQAYAVLVYTEAGTVNAGVTALVQAVKPLLVQVYDYLLDAERNEQQASVDCSRR